MIFILYYNSMVFCYIFLRKPWYLISLMYHFVSFFIVHRCQFSVHSQTSLVCANQFLCMFILSYVIIFVVRKTALCYFSQVCFWQRWLQYKARLSTDVSFYNCIARYLYEIGIIQVNNIGWFCHMSLRSVTVISHMPKEEQDEHVFFP